MCRQWDMQTVQDLEILSDGQEGHGLKFQQGYGDMTGPGWEGRVWKCGRVPRGQMWWWWWGGVKMKSEDGKPAKARAEAHQGMWTLSCRQWGAIGWC